MYALSLPRPVLPCLQILLSLCLSPLLPLPSHTPGAKDVTSNRNCRWICATWLIAHAEMNEGAETHAPSSPHFPRICHAIRHSAHATSTGSDLTAAAGCICQRHPPPSADLLLLERAQSGLGPKNLGRAKPKIDRED